MFNGTEPWGFVNKEGAMNLSCHANSCCPTLRKGLIIRLLCPCFAAHTFPCSCVSVCVCACVCVCVCLGVKDLAYIEPSLATFTPPPGLELTGGVLQYRAAHAHCARFTRVSSKCPLGRGC